MACIALAMSTCPCCAPAGAVCPACWTFLPACAGAAAAWANAAAGDGGGGGGGGSFLHPATATTTNTGNTKTFVIGDSSTGLADCERPTAYQQRSGPGEPAGPDGT